MIKRIIIAMLAIAGGLQDGPATLSERKVGKAMFKVEKSTSDGHHVLVTPLMVPSLRIERLKGDGLLNDTIVSCVVYDRIISHDDVNQVDMHITVLKCDGKEYGVMQIDFVMEP